MQIKTETIVGIFILGALGAFFYMTLQIGVFRFDRNRYVPYIAYFKDISGLAKKAEVKMAGVKVGWIDDVRLVEEGELVQTRLMILKDYTLHVDGYALIRQEGLLGTKYLEIVPGTPTAPRLPPGGTLTRRSIEPTSVDDILTTVKKVADNIQDVSISLKDALTGVNSQGGIKDTLLYFGQAAQSIAHASETLERLLIRNEENLNSITYDVREVIRDLKDRLPSMTQSIAAVADRLHGDFLPNFSADVHNVATDLNKAIASISQISNQLQSDFLPRIAGSADTLARSIDTVVGSIQGLGADAGASFKHINSVAQKISEGQGLLGKLINEDETYYDLRSAVRSVKNSLDKIDRIAIILDAHVESMQGLVEKRFSFQDAKGYVNLRIHPSEDYFYLAGLAFSQRGYITRKTTHYRYFDEKNNQIFPTQLRQEGQLFDNVARREIIKEYRDATRLNLQIGKIFNDVALRIGLFEGAFGLAVDYNIPFDRPGFQWITTFEAWDFKGRNRIFGDVRPHLKWLNRMFVSPNLYFAFGADDFISKFNKNAFVGAGLRFADDDLKYIISKVPLGF